MLLRRTAYLALTLCLSLPPVAAVSEGIAGPYLAAVQATYRNDYTTAAEYFVQASAHDPGNPFLIQNGIVNNVIADRFQVAVPLARQILEQDADHQLAGLVLIADALQREQYDTAGDMLADESLRLNPLLAGLLAGWVQAGKGDITQAQASFDAMSSNSNFSPIGQFHKGMVLALAGNFDGAAEILAGDADGPLHINRASIVAHVQVLVQLGQGDEAIALIDDTPGAGFDPELVQLRARIADGAEVPFDYITSPQDGAAEVFLTLATALVQEEADRFALIYARLAQQIRPGYVDALLVSAGIFDDQGQFDLASSDFARVPETSAAYVSAEIGRANAKADAGDADQAVEALQSLTAKFSDDARTFEALGDALRREERYEEAAASYSQVIDRIQEATRGDWRSYYVRGIAYERTGEWDKAEADFRKALELQPEQPLVLNYLGYSLVELNLKIDEAKDMIERALAGDPDNGFITDSLGWVLYRTGQFEDAVPHMERAVELMPSDPVINDHLGDVLWKVGRKNEAVFQWKRALSFEPEEKDATRIRRKLDVGLDVVLEEEATSEN